ncbi:MAG: methyl-accepting chemotaxis protein [Deltaproteobacteria bacterium]|nr:methyl-accepting chemotaxis protein [Deltaproteobacteria bacterium]
MLKNIKIGPKLLLLIFVPIIGLLIFGAMTVTDRYTNLRNIRETQTLVAFSVKAGALVHELQKERGLTAGHLKSQGAKFKNELADQRQKSDQQVTSLTSFLSASDSKLAAMDKEIKNSSVELSGLKELRGKVDILTIPAGDAIKSYTQLIRSYLDAIAVIPMVSKSREIAMDAVGYHAFISTKEMAGQERAVANGGFAADKFDQELYLKVPSLIAAQNAYLDLFRKYADSKGIAAYQERSAAAPFQKVEEYRKTALDKGIQGGMGVAPEEWFSTITAKINLLKEVEDLLAADINNLANESAGTAKTAMVISLVLTAALVIISLLLGLVVIRGITGPLQELVHMLKDIAEGEGDLSRRLPENSRDETGEVAHWFNRFISNIHSIISQASTTTVQVATASNQLHNTAEQIATAAEEVASQSSTVATASEEMSATSNDISHNCTLASDIANRASDMAHSGANVVQETISGMQSIADKVRESSHTVAALGARSDQIGAIVGTIEDIADQTNLLALNAAIEAARAGEQGRGFAVVADEVRALAERTTRATREIGEMIKAIQKETGGAVASMESGVKEVEKGMDSSRRSGEALQQILEGINEVTMQVHQIATAAEEQTAVTGEISTNIHQITDVVQQTANGAHQTAGAASSLLLLAKDLEGLVGRFKL